MYYSRSVYFIPVWFDRYEQFVGKFSKSDRWELVPSEKYAPRYLLNYVTRIANDKSLMQMFSLNDIESLNVYMYEDELKYEIPPEITEVRFSCFATGVGFIEFWVDYKGWTPEEISNFAYLFKKAAKKRTEDIPESKQRLYDAALSLLPQKSNASVFFSCTTPFKYECNCFHFMHLEGTAKDENTAQRRLELLRRSYHTEFTQSADSEYDMAYCPYEYDQWGGSPEGLVNINYDSGNESADYFMQNYKVSHLSVDYYFLYLILLNQKFSAIQYILMISEMYDGKNSDIENSPLRCLCIGSSNHSFLTIITRKERDRYN